MPCDSRIVRDRVEERPLRGGRITDGERTLHATRARQGGGADGGIDRALLFGRTRRGLRRFLLGAARDREREDGEGREGCDSSHGCSYINGLLRRYTRLGTSNNADGKETAGITGDSASDDQVTFVDDEGDTVRFNARLGRLAGLRVLDLEPDSLASVLRREPGLVAHRPGQGERGPVITAPTPEVRRFFADLVQRPGILSDSAVYRRTK